MGDDEAKQQWVLPRKKRPSPISTDLLEIPETVDLVAIVIRAAQEQAAHPPRFIRRYCKDTIALVQNTAKKGSFVTVFKFNEWSMKSLVTITYLKWLNYMRNGHGWRCSWGCSEDGEVLLWARISIDPREL